MIAAGLIYGAVMFFWLTYDTAMVTTVEFANMRVCQAAAEKLMQQVTSPFARAVCVDRLP